MQDGASAINDLVTAAATKSSDGSNDNNSGTDNTDKAKTDDNKDGSEGNKNAAEEADQSKVDKNAKTGSDSSDTNKVEDKPFYEQYGFKSKEEFDTFLAEKKKEPETDEEKKKKQDLYHTSISSFAVEKDLMKLEDLNKLNEVKAKADKDLVFESFSAERLEEAKEEMEEGYTEAQLKARLEELFQEEYPTESKNKRVQARAENRLKKDAAEIRNPLESSFNTAKSKYDENQEVRAAMPGYMRFMEETVSKIVPEKLNFYTGKEGDEDVVVDVEVTKEVKEEILNSLKSAFTDNPETFVLHKNGKAEDIQKKIKEAADYLLWQKLKSDGTQKLTEKFVEIGKKKGSNVGAENSFATNQAKTGAAAVVKDAKQQVLDSTSKK